MCCANQAQMIKQHRQLSMSVRRTIENNEESGIRSSKTCQSFVATAGGHRELNFIKKYVRNYTTREVQNVSELEDAKEFGKYLLRMKKKNQNFHLSLNLRLINQLRLFFGPTQEAGLLVSILKMLFHSISLRIQTYNILMVLGTTSDFHVMVSLLGLSDVVTFSVLIFIRGVKLYVFWCISVLIEFFEYRHLWILVYLDHKF
ncbi:hypothetical protein Ahy_A05g022882 [Arachis hypogaea]|uniref:Uncharacterized protein n=1 Tax=Arachis hypogaea TaxID=3818 RepID=A0A445D1T4_ARAHY|nr:hypothetical protein Ahy_A05g022882 [Arachis hypogaea]